MHELSRLLFASVFTLTLGTLASSSRADQPKVGVAGAVNPATHATPEGGQTAILTIGNDVMFNEVITTDAEGQAQLLFLDRSALTVGPNARLTIDEFVYNPNTKEGKLAINAAVGVFRFVGGQLSKSGDVTLKTPVATIGIRGAVALVTVTPTSVSASLLFGNGLTITPITQQTNAPGGGQPGGGQQGGGQQGGGQQGGGQQGGGQQGGAQQGGTPGGGTTGGAPTGGGGGGGGTILVTAGNTANISNTGQINVVQTTNVTVSTSIKQTEPTKQSTSNANTGVTSTTVNQTITTQTQNGTGGAPPSLLLTNTTTGQITVPTNTLTTQTGSPPAPSVQVTQAPVTQVFTVPPIVQTVPPTIPPTAAPTAAPTQAPTPAPTQAPTPAPTAAPTPAPTAAPTPAPTAAPTPAPTAAPTSAPGATTAPRVTAPSVTPPPTQAPPQRPQ